VPFRDLRSALTDIGAAIDAIYRFIEGMDCEAYQADERTQAAVERKLLVISEAAIRLGNEAETICPDLPWRDIRGMGNWLRHQYDAIELETIWNTIQDDLPLLRTAIGNAIAALPEANQ
jgi:uncharacterized protein with HEPN domain